MDTDLSSDTDDASALAMLLGWPGVELTGITTAIDPGGRRAGYVQHCLDLAGRDGIPVAAGAEVSLTTLVFPGDIPDEARLWGQPIPPRPSPPGAALDLLAASIESGATVVAIGPCTNLALLEVLRPGLLGSAPIVLMGGWVAPPAPGLPQWGPEVDWNVQCDTRAAEVVFRAAGGLTLVTLAATAKVHLRAMDLVELEEAGPLVALLARQGRAHGEQYDMAQLGQSYPGLPDDLLNFQHDALACAVAVGWDGAPRQDMTLSPIHHGDILSYGPDPAGRVVSVVVDADGSAFARLWLDAVAKPQE